MSDSGDRPPLSEKLSERARSGVLWLTLVNVATRGSQMVVTLVVAAIFTESDLGVVSLAMALVNAAIVVQVMGVSHVISRTERDEHVMAGTVLTLSMLPSTALTVIGVLGSSPIADALGAPAAAPLIAVLAIGLPFMAIAWLQMALMNRALDFRRRMLPDVGSAVLGAAVTIWLAVVGVGPMSVAIGFLTAAVVQPLFGYLVGVRVRPRWDRGAAAEALHWSANVGVGAVVYTVLINVDFPIVSRVLGPDALGLYSLAFRIGWLPYLLMSVVLASVAFPLYARLIREGRQRELRGAVARTTHVLLLVVGGMYVVLFLLSDYIVLLNERWAPAAPVLMVLCGYGFGLSLLTLWYETIIVCGRLRLYLCLQISHLVLLVILLVTFAQFGIVATAFAQVAAVWILVSAVWVALARARLAPPLGDLARAIAGFAAPALVCVGIAVIARRTGLRPEPASLGDFVIHAVVLSACYVAVGTLTNRSLVTSLLKRRQAPVL